MLSGDFFRCDGQDWEEIRVMMQRTRLDEEIDKCCVTDIRWEQAN